MCGQWSREKLCIAQSSAGSPTAHVATAAFGRPAKAKPSGAIATSQSRSCSTLPCASLIGELPIKLRRLRRDVPHPDRLVASDLLQVRVGLPQTCDQFMRRRIQALPGFFRLIVRNHDSVRHCVLRHSAAWRNRRTRTLVPEHLPVLRIRKSYSPLALSVGILFDPHL